MGPPSTRRPDESMTLLTEMLTRPLDPSYAAASQRRVARGEAPHTPVGSALVALTAVLIGLLFAVSAGTVRRSAPSTAGVRADLIAQIDARRHLAEERSRAIVERQQQIATLESNSLAGAGSAMQEELQLLGLATGTGQVSGPGLVVSLADRPAGNGSDSPADADQGTVLSRDVFIVVNALWESGAEAIAINGQRLTVRSPIRFAGSAILVNFRPLSPPYVISAIGDPDQLPERFAASVGGAYVKSLTDNFGIVSSVTTQKEMTLPGATRVNVERARPLGGSS